MPTNNHAIIEPLTTELEAVKAERDEIANKLSEAISDIEDLGVSWCFEMASVGMSVIQKEQLRTLCEGLEFTDNDNLQSKMEILREAHFSKPVMKKSSSFGIIDEDMLNDLPKHVSPEMNSYIKATNRLTGRFVK